MDWDRKAKENILPLSKEQSGMDTALAEWYYTGKVSDHIVPSRTCQLCENTGLRYHFEIKNKETKNILLVGSSCILLFGIAVYGDSGKLLKGKEKEKKLTDKIREIQTEAALEDLRQLWMADMKLRDIIDTYIESFEERKGFSPKQLLFLYKQMKKNKISYEPSYYKVALRSDKDKDKLLEMSSQDLELIWPGLSLNQQRNYPVLKKKKQEEEKQLERIKRKREEILQKKRGRYSGRDTSISLIYNSPLPEEKIQENRPIGEQNNSFGNKEAVCILCGQITSDWWYYDGVTKTCKCNDCRI